jgi:ATP-dependent DNA helicase RecG
MTSGELKERLAAGENLHTEFKRWPIQPDDLASSLVAFANADGGLLLLGVDDQGQVSGIAATDLDRLTQLVDNVAFQNCEPPVTVVQETVPDEAGQVVVVVHVSKGEQRPYWTNRGVLCVRTSSGRRQTSREELLRLFQATESLY